MIILKGYSRSTGTIETGKVLVDKNTGEAITETRAYDNFVLHYVTNDNPAVKGWFCDNVKAAADTLKLVGAKTLDAMLDKEVMFSMDMTQRTDVNGRAKQVVAAVILVGDVK